MRSYERKVVSTTMTNKTNSIAVAVQREITTQALIKRHNEKLRREAKRQAKKSQGGDVNE